VQKLVVAPWRAHRSFALQFDSAEVSAAGGFNGSYISDQQLRVGPRRDGRDLVSQN
jgi:hypothetical protein